MLLGGLPSSTRCHPDKPKPRTTSTAGDWTFVDAAHGSRTAPRLSLPPVVHENRFAALETDASDDATIEMSDDGFDTPSDMSMAHSRYSPVVELEGPTEDPQNWSQAVKSVQMLHPCDSSSLPPGAKVLGSRFIFRTKRDQLGKITSHKGRLVAQGFSQRPGIDYDETFAPKLHVHQADVDKAYLHGELKEDLYMRVPQGVDMPGKVLKLHRSIYGLKQAGRVWNEHIHLTLEKPQLPRPQPRTTACTLRRDGDHYHYIALYVDDLLMVSPSEDEIERILRRFGMSDSSPASTPMARTDSSNIRSWKHPKLLGHATCRLLDASCTPPPTVFWYLRGTACLGLHYSSEQGKFSGFTGYSDADWGTCTTSSRSTMGYSFHLAGSVISWSSKVQNRVADSTTDAEYLALSHASKEAAPVQLYGDNQGAIALAKNPTLHHRSRHIRIREHFVRDQVRLGTIQVDYVDTKTMVADIFTKALGPLVFKVHRDNLGLRG
ncbi:BZ3500_MvSof-1268-A1-R1_C104g00574 [Microbotryum saponariae]|uniref:BZ3500_MvSof-1268-A1-R1_C104g00574 protein n=1 Tax=Microbotryum saponariae TaxID=289078 RepID=A0A2X0L339_9BASI|nr:BZ3500_MvSof-1268-A1-R1_C104g00574 [Microbotryum saponariae]